MLQIHERINSRIKSDHFHGLYYTIYVYFARLYRLYAMHRAYLNNTNITTNSDTYTTTTQGR